MFLARDYKRMNETEQHVLADFIRSIFILAVDLERMSRFKIPQLTGFIEKHCHQLLIQNIQQELYMVSPWLPYTATQDVHALLDCLRDFLD